MRGGAGPPIQLAYVCRVGGMRFARLFKADLPVNIFVEVCKVCVRVLLDQERHQGSQGGLKTEEEEGEEEEEGGGGEGKGKIEGAEPRPEGQDKKEGFERTGTGRSREVEVTSFLRHTATCGGFPVALAFLRSEHAERERMKMLIRFLGRLEAEQASEGDAGEEQKTSLVTLYSELF